MLPYRTAYMNGFQLFGDKKLSRRCGKVSKKFLTASVFPVSKYCKNYLSNKISCLNMDV